MSAQPEALRLADEYASDGWIAGTRQWCEEAAAELRRQHAANLDCIAWYEAAKAQRDELLKALKAVMAQTNSKELAAAFDMARAAIAKAEAP